MPQITVEYSDTLADSFDRQAFGRALHAASADLIGSGVPAHKTRFYPVSDAVIGDGSAGHAMVHVDFRMLSGRTDTIKTELAHVVLELLQKFVLPVEGISIQATVEIGNLDRGHYHKVMIDG